MRKLRDDPSSIKNPAPTERSRSDVGRNLHIVFDALRHRQEIESSDGANVRKAAPSHQIEEGDCLIDAKSPMEITKLKLITKRE
jgi:hypothetical protein